MIFGSQSAPESRAVRIRLFELVWSCGRVHSHERFRLLRVRTAERPSRTPLRLLLRVHRFRLACLAPPRCSRQQPTSTADDRTRERQPGEPRHLQRPLLSSVMSLRWWHRLLCRILRQSAHTPQHVAFIMDGNRRYAKQHHVRTVEGHTKGYDKLKEVSLWQAGVASSAARHSAHLSSVARLPAADVASSIPSPCSVRRPWSGASSSA